MVRTDIQNLLLQYGFQIDLWGGYVKTVPVLMLKTGEMTTGKVRVVFKDRVVNIFKQREGSKDWVKVTWSYYREVELDEKGLIFRLGSNAIGVPGRKNTRVYNNEEYIRVEESLKAKGKIIKSVNAATLPAAV